MTNKEIFGGFFSYSHFDAALDPSVIEAFSTDLQNRVNSRLINASFELWIDRERLKIGYQWNNRILDAIEKSDILIVILTPKWLDSDYCRKELLKFLESEEKLEIGEYIAPIMARSIETQLRCLSIEQKSTYNKLSERQYLKHLIRDFIKLGQDERNLLIEGIADDIEGMIERLRSIRKEPASSSVKAVPRRVLAAEFNAKAHNFEHVDFLSDAEVVIEKRNGESQRSVFAHVGFVPRLYIQTKSIRVEFGIQRALLSLGADEANQLIKSDEIRSGELHPNAYYVNWRPSPSALTLCIEPASGNSTLQEIPLEPAKDENRLAKIADAAPEIDYSKVSARLFVSMNAEGLFIYGDQGQKPPAVQMKKIAAIANIALEKEEKLRLDYIERAVPVREKSR